MARFTTTIQLHNADESDYTLLDTVLAKSSFRGVRKKKPGQADNLPDKREYNRDGNVTIQDVTDAVVKAAAGTGKKYSFTIIRNKPVYN
ncbi:MAG: hypothetical protein ABW019_17875, partial [Chitinophagaceae bacterium]